MKKLSLLFVVLILLEAACKKAPDCGLHSHNYNGKCVCNGWWFGANCDSVDACRGIVCGLHQHCVNGTCVCDSGFTGGYCQYEIACLNTTCGTHSQCLAGVCVCDSGWMGINCQTPILSCVGVNCGTHGHCVNGYCQCDSGWAGTNCDIPSANTFAGSYHVTGTQTIWHSPSGSIDTLDLILAITEIDSLTLISSLRSEHCTFMDVPNYYQYSWIAGPWRMDIRFPRSDVDSIDYNYSAISPGGGSVTSLTGRKIH